MYEPTDLTLSVEAGATLAEVQTVLGEHGQWLPIDAPNPERATIGGLIATALFQDRGDSGRKPSGIFSSESPWLIRVAR